MKKEQRNVMFAACSWEEIASFTADYIRAARISFDSCCEDSAQLWRRVAAE